MTNDTQGPIILWEDYGSEGWKPRSYPSLKLALLDPHYNRFIITKAVTFEVTEIKTESIKGF